MDLLRNPVRPYAWGSRTAISELLGRPIPAPHPEAELWLGAHPSDSSVLVRPDGTEAALTELLHADPIGQLGSKCADRWGPRLPFLMKVLAAEEPLSLQAHPSSEQAEEGFEREEAAGVPLLAPTRNYRDSSHKPELICALTEFHALAGFRDAQVTLRFLDALDVPTLRPYTGLLAAEPGPGGLRALFTTLITLPQRALDVLLPPVLEGCVRHLRERGAFGQECRTVLELGEAYPGDAGVLAALLLNRVVLQPGEAIYLPAGNLHSYLLGTGVEIMANSDNVLRGGLTPKHVDVPELMRVLDFAHGPMPVLTGDQEGQHLTVYRTPAEEFQLSRIDWDADEVAPVALTGATPQLLLCTDGQVTLTSPEHGELEVCRGQSVWLPAEDPPVRVRPATGARTQLFHATAPLG
ncbi:mannose-6-phosphate isomerase, class I [Actinoalloteichus sp. AHMU CJ021]|uniref:mannose-6-phosphate isomerase n=1 Tax=Actinoalloteichus caeruleus DSM 43889 TaxID=1120930 RepID=A0ABT1JMG0_ACTCY|nr:mannose-6-phosphate isomerase, class I [Actinoalloteichus caeruleus]AUS79404.1 mannose-6-phosphate isomerase, class I [Actinoalloteichus sp. AHMU CJ021]MCP2333711.1 mannose-6-phosphate isomerase, type 1 [Actinoalloteichus caeruleus DSM 43889]